MNGQRVRFVLGTTRIFVNYFQTVKIFTRNFTLRSTFGQTQVQPNVNPVRKTSLVIFDKDGTLICFHAMWAPWAVYLAESIHKDTKHPSANIAQKVYELLGFCPRTNVVKGGLLAEATNAEIRSSLIKLIMDHGVSAGSANKIVETAFKHCETCYSLNTVKPLDNLQTLFQTLKQNDIKIAICTSDNRKQTEKIIKKLELSTYIDMIACGDDVGMKPKPDPHNALQICKTLRIDPKEAIMVGDTLTDIGFGKSANLGTTVGVLSGIGREEELLEKGADYVIHKVGDLVPLIIKQTEDKHLQHQQRSSLSFLNNVKRFFAGRWCDAEEKALPDVKPVAILTRSHGR